MLLPDWKQILKKAWSVRVLALLAVLDFMAAVVILTIDGLATSVLENHTAAVIAALSIKSLMSVAGIVLRVKVQKEAEEAVT